MVQTLFAEMKSVGVLLALTGGSRECAQKKLIEREQSIMYARLVVPHSGSIEWSTSVLTLKTVHSFAFTSVACTHGHDACGFAGQRDVQNGALR